MKQAVKNAKPVYVFAADIWLQYPTCLFTVKNEDVAITRSVTEELERIARRGRNEEAGNAERALNEIEFCLEDDNADLFLTENTTVLKNGTVFVFDSIMASDAAPYECRIVDDCRMIMVDRPNVILVTNKISLSIAASDKQISVQRFHGMVQESKEEQYTGRADIIIPENEFNEFYKTGECDAPEDQWLEENQFVLMHNATNPNAGAPGYHQAGKIYKLKYAYTRPYGITTKNIGQEFAIEALLRPVEEAPLVILKGPAGTAKTFLALAAGLQSVLNQATYRRILVTRANIKFDQDIGYLKGSESEKIAPLIRPIFDNLEQLTQSQGGARKDGIRLEDTYANELFSRGLIKAEALAYMRGRSISETWVIVDEAQNMTPAKAYGIVTRIGVGSKVILCGDPEQCDEPSLNAFNNGISYVSERMKGSPLCWQVTFSEKECMRSDLAKDALRRMKPLGRNSSIGFDIKQ